MRKSGPRIKSKKKQKEKAPGKRGKLYSLVFRGKGRRCIIKQ